MDAKDLMIGDWVIRKGVPEEKLRVVAIDSIQGIVYLDLDGLGITEKLTNIEPIPLTFEILEKNGFRKESYIEVVGGLDTYYLGEEIGSFRIHRLQKGYYQFGLAKINFVHQLQHALKLCGINKEIEI